MFGVIKASATKSHQIMTVRKKHLHNLPKTPTFHLVNGIDVNRHITTSSELHVLSDTPKIKNISNKLTYTLAETPHGVVAFESKHSLKELKKYLQLSHYVVNVSPQDLDEYKRDGSSVIVIYNCYCDIATKNCYYLYYTH